MPANEPSSFNQEIPPAVSQRDAHQEHDMRPLPWRQEPRSPREVVAPRLFDVPTMAGPTDWMEACSIFPTRKGSRAWIRNNTP